mmetsp:Transcript_2593/g.5041  ORF Transcript_2593/g.5041 Transcript_2593/m.5041 type:complete len:203 (+) Transcript_2593:1594-2202(+)
MKQQNIHADGLRQYRSRCQGEEGLNTKQTKSAGPQIRTSLDHLADVGKRKTLLGPACRKIEGRVTGKEARGTGLGAEPEMLQRRASCSRQIMMKTKMKASANTNMKARNTMTRKGAKSGNNKEGNPEKGRFKGPQNLHSASPGASACGVEVLPGPRIEEKATKTKMRMICQGRRTESSTLYCSRALSPKNLSSFTCAQTASG